MLQDKYRGDKQQCFITGHGGGEVISSLAKKPCSMQRDKVLQKAMRDKEGLKSVLA